MLFYGTYIGVMGNRKTTPKDRPTKPTIFTLERKISLQVIQFVDQALVNTRSSILTVCKANLCFACQGQQIFAFS